MILEEQKLKLAELFETIRTLKEAERTADPQYLETYNEMAKTFEIVKDLERQRGSIGDQLIKEECLENGNPEESASKQKAKVSEAQIYQLNHQIEAFKRCALYRDLLDDDEGNLEDRVQILNPQAWKNRREKMLLETQKIYEDKIKNNHLLNSHDLLGYIDKKLINNGYTFFDMTQMTNHPYEKEQIENLNKLDQSKYLSAQLESCIEQNQFEDPNELTLAKNNLKCLQLYPFQQHLRTKVLMNYMANEVALGQHGVQTTGDIMYSKQLVDRQFYKRSKAPAYNKKEARTLDRFENNMRSGQELRKKTRHREFLKEILDHAKDFHEFHKKRQNQTKRKATIFKAHLDNRANKKNREKIQEEAKRKDLLRQNNFDDWLQLINIEKNERLMEILNQTNKYIEELGKKVHIQKTEVGNIRQGKIKGKKGNMKNAEQDDEVVEEEKDEELNSDLENMDESDRIKWNLKNSSNVYFKITHAIQDEVKDQPKMLSGGVMKGFQVYGLNWMVSLYNNNLNGILADEMGLGKTIQTIALFAHLIEVKHNTGPFLVVVPLTTISNWTLEFEKWAPDIKVIIYKGKKSERPLLAKIIHSEKFNVLITTYEYIMHDKAVLSKLIWQYIVVDEGHRMKNQKSRFAQTMGMQYNSAHRILLTGTPLQNNLSELWALLNFLLPKIFSSCEDFQKWFDKALSKNQGAKTMTQEERDAMELTEEEKLLIINRLHQILRPFLLRRLKVEVAKELPQKIEMVIKVELSAQQKLVYQGIQENNQLMVDPTRQKSKISLKNAIMQLRKICNHPYLFEGHQPNELNDHIFNVSGKFELLDRMLPKMIKTGHKILIFSQFTQLIDVMKLYFIYRGIPHLILDGRTKHEDRTACLARFSEEDSTEKVFILSTKAGGLGLNLQVSDTVIIFDSDWNPQMDKQAEDRAYRIGQRHEVRVYRLITATKVEEGILQKATYKKGLDNKIIQAGMFNDNASDVDRQKKLEEFLRSGDDQDDEDSENMAEKESEIPTDEQINQMMARSPEELIHFDEMDQQMYLREGKEERMKMIMEQRPGLKDYSHINYRLIQEWEVPDWIRVKPVSKEDEEDLLMNLGKRVRKTVMNIDNLTEQQFLKALEDGDDLQEVIERENVNREKRRNGNEGPLGSSEEEEEQDAAYGDQWDAEKSSKRRKQDSSYQAPHLQGPNGQEVIPKEKSAKRQTQQNPDQMQPKDDENVQDNLEDDRAQN